MTHLLALLLALPTPSTPLPSGSLSGKVVMMKSGVPLPDASNAVVWIEGLRRSGDPSGTVRAEMKSEKKRFTPRVVAVPKSASVNFPNVDPIYHNVFSVSGANRFDLGLYRSGASKANPFGEPGLVRVYCNIHPQMVGFVMVVNSDTFTTTGADGAFRFLDVPAGSYTLKAWHEEGSEVQTHVSVRASRETPVTVSIDVSGFRPVPHKNKYGKDYPPQAGSDDERY